MIDSDSRKRWDEQTLGAIVAPLWPIAAQVPINGSMPRTIATPRCQIAMPAPPNEHTPKAIATRRCQIARVDHPLTVAFIDLDGMKEINDTRGHRAGDQMLVRVVDTLRLSLRSYDLIVRFGGDEFLCVMPGLKRESAEVRFDDVHASLATHH